MACLELKLLGPPVVRREGQNLTLGPKALSLVALLATEEKCSRERVLGMLWPDSTQKRAQGSLRYLLHSLRKSTEELVRSENGSLALGADVGLDLRKLKLASSPSQRSQAAQLQRGPFCEGLPADTPEFEDWLAGQREHWERAGVENLLELARSLPAREGIKPARQAVTTDPLNESAHALLIELLMKVGDVSEAHQQLGRCRKILWEELGIEPAVTTERLVEARQEQSWSHNLPSALHELVGRDGEISELQELLIRHRLVTLTGEGGIGKTSLGLAVAREMAEQRNVWLVELAKLTDTAEVADEVASTLGLKKNESWTDIFERETLLFLDNCEHLCDSAAAFAQQVLAECPAVTILATSREPLRIGAERVYPLMPLSVEPGELEPAAVRLFKERARQHGATSQSLENREVLLQVCSRLDGLPLAIELAAARLKSVSLEQLLQGLDKRFRVLRSTARDGEARQQTLSALIDWSYRRLSEEEKRHFRQLSVFRSGFFLEAAGAVLQLDEWDTADALEVLLDKSLLRQRPEGGGLRYDMLESMREFGLERLEESAEGEQTRERHLAHFLELAHSLCPLTKGEKQKVWLDQLDSELVNFRVALQFGLEHRPSQALDLAAALCPLWKERDHRTEGRDVLKRALDRVPRSDSQWPRALLLRGELETQHALCEQAKQTLEEALELAQQRKAPELVARAAKGLGSACLFLGDFEAGFCWYEKGREGYLQVGDRHEHANCINNQGLACLYSGRYQEAEQFLNQALELYLEEGHEIGVGIARGNLADLCRARGNPEQALELFALALSELDKVGALWNTAYFLERMGRTLAALERYEEAVTTLAAAQAIRDRLSTPRLPTEVEEYEALKAGLAEELGEGFAVLWEEGLEHLPNTQPRTWT